MDVTSGALAWAAVAVPYSDARGVHSDLSGPEAAAARALGMAWITRRDVLVSRDPAFGQLAVGRDGAREVP